MAQQIKNRVSRGGKRGLSPTLGRPAEQALAFAAGAAFAAAAVRPGMQPFGASYTATAKHPLPAAVGAFASYVLTLRADGLVYGAAVMVILTCRMVMEGTKLTKNRLFRPVCASAALACTKGVILRGGLKGALLLLCETALCFGFAALLREAKDARSPLCPWGRLTAGLCLLLTALPLRLWGVISPARICGAFLALSAGTFGGGTAGASIGACFGAAMDTAQGRGPLLALFWTGAGLTAGLSGRHSRLAAALCSAGACSILALWLPYGTDTRQALMEIFFAASLLVLLPERSLLRLSAGLAGAGAALERNRAPLGGEQALYGISDAVAQLGAAMETVLHRAPAEDCDPGQICRAACETACRSCARRERCWLEEQGDVRRVLSDLTDRLRTQHAVSAEELPDWFLARCLRPQRFCGAVNDAYRASLRRRAMHRQTDALCSLMGRQYRSLGALLEGLAAKPGGGAQYDAVLESRVKRIVRAYLPRARVTACLTEGRLQIDLRLPGAPEDYEGDHSAMLRSLEGALSASLLPPHRVDCAGGAAFRICQREKLAVKTAGAVRKKEGQTVCGDCHRILHTDDGRALLLLSDGMGTGEAAGNMARRALELVCSFVQSGCGLAESTAAVLPVLAARFEEWGFVTLDLAEINLFSGRASLLKYGAAPGFLLREGRLTRLSAQALPAGLESTEGDMPLIALRLRAGDELILLSDGVWEMDSVEGFLAEHTALAAEALAEKLAETARASGAEDDLTVLIAEISAADA